MFLRSFVNAGSGSDHAKRRGVSDGAFAASELPSKRFKLNTKAGSDATPARAISVSCRPRSTCTKLFTGTAMVGSSPTALKVRTSYCDIGSRMQFLGLLMLRAMDFKWCMP